jgi:hypothetical protein
MHSSTNRELYRAKMQHTACKKNTSASQGLENKNITPGIMEISTMEDETNYVM